MPTRSLSCVGWSALPEQSDLASVDALPGAHPEVDWEQLRSIGKGRRPPLAAPVKAKETAPA
ncbi:hypothetical protein [Streptomyces umbrinus]|uniref:hypothetical protein n=1 Tax=Streptomyces umbrinus TaxID=67370 RepID=UPI003C2C7D3C